MVVLGIAYEVQIVVLNHQNLIQGGPRGGASNDQESNFSPHKSSEGSIFFTPTKKMDSLNRVCTSFSRYL